jgi:hypothetical protein
MNSCELVRQKANRNGVSGDIFSKNFPVKSFSGKSITKTWLARQFIPGIFLLKNLEKT